ncbi:acetoacetate decarboxylase family protein [Oceanicoccus sp. KOV_DT_Chl]|uniref:acetoacetate decarboxylase family protein n=1 Tax=Oceanicoccus sp. KOV_DT_Chl TaxID=1904639 RepID=UPI000C7C3BB8|nr:acetoacetate decarboxylase family protein [Oceanicoccus sp. KOV_DT_Chl]
MKVTGAVFDEPAIASEVDGVARERFTADVCKKIDDHNYLIDGQAVDFPVVVAEASMLMNAFLVDAKVAQSMIADSGFQVVELFPGKAILQLLFVDYRKNDLGDYNEGAIIFPVLTPGQKKPFPFFGTLKQMGAGTLGNFVYRMPVDQEYTTHAGRYIWGFPKWVSRVDIEFEAKRATGRFIDEGELVYALAAKAGGTGASKEMRAPSLAIREGKAWKTYGSNSGSGVTFSLGGEMPEIGETHPLAKELRALGLPKKPLFSISIAQTAMRFEGPESAAIGQPFSK